jgi:excisionase family DNA binding protein
VTLAVPERNSLAEPLLYSVRDARKALGGMSHTVIYDLMRRGRLRSVKEGRSRLIPVSAIAEYVALLEREAGEQK